jgi:nucleoid DNA-binding protein
MIISNDDNETIHNISLISGIKEEDIRTVFESFLIQFTLKYCSNKRIHIPFIGNFLVRYRADELTEEGKEALLDAFFSPHEEIKRIVGQLHDIEKTKDYLNIDVVTELKKILKQDFKTKISSDDHLEF